MLPETQESFRVESTNLNAPVYPWFGSVTIHALLSIIIPLRVRQIAKMHKNVAAASTSKSERDNLLVPDHDNVIEIVAIMENGNHTADIPRRTQQQVSCRSIQGVPPIVDWVGLTWVIIFEHPNQGQTNTGSRVRGRHPVDECIIRLHFASYISICIGSILCSVWKIELTKKGAFWGPREFLSKQLNNRFIAATIALSANAAWKILHGGLFGCTLQFCSHWHCPSK